MTLITQYLTIKETIKTKGKTLNEELMRNSDFAEFTDDLKASREVLSAHKFKLLQESSELNALSSEIGRLKAERALILEQIKADVSLVSKSTGAVLQYSFDFSF